MPEKLICPECNKPSYTASPESYNPCPYCGFIFNNKSLIGPDKRLEQRLYWSASCQLSQKDTTDSGSTLIMAKTEDISQTGLRIRYAGGKLIPGNTVNISIKDLNLETSALVMWSKDMNEGDKQAGLHSLSEVHLPFHSQQGKPVFNEKSLLKEFSV